MSTSAPGPRLRPAAPPAGTPPNPLPPGDPTARAADRSIGALLVDSGKISMAQADQIIQMQKELGIRFGEAALRLKLVSEDDIRFALARQHGYGYLRKGDSQIAASVRAAFQPYSPQAEAMRALRSQLMLRWFTGRPDHRCLAVVSPDPKEGRSHVTANLAVAFSQLGERTLVIDANLRRPAQHKLFGLPDKAGLSSLLSRRAAGPAIVALPELPNLSLLPAGPIPPNPQELLGQDQFSQLLQQLSQEFDVILIDTPDAKACADAHTVAVRAGAALIVVRERVSRLARVQELNRSLAGLDATVVGTVVNKY